MRTVGSDYISSILAGTVPTPVERQANRAFTRGDIQRFLVLYRPLWPKDTGL